jgi:hypothetical protein
MKRRWNYLPWAGFLVCVGAFLSYLLFFYRFESTRDFPWASLLLFAVGGWLSAVGLKRAYGQPELYAGKISGPILTALNALVLALFIYGFFFATKALPRSTGAPNVGQKAPDFTLPDQNGNAVSLSSLLASPANPAVAGNKTNAVLLIFYRGTW